MKNMIFVALILALVLGCSNSTKVSTGNSVATASNSTSPSDSTSIRRVLINQTKNFNGLDVTIGEIALEKGKITVGITLNNNTKETMTTYPDQGEIIIGRIQLDNNMFSDSGDLGGEIHAGVEKQGTLAFLDSQSAVDMAAVKEIDFRLGTVYGKNFMKQQEIKWPVQIP